MRIENNEIVILNPASKKEVGRVAITNNDEFISCVGISEKYIKWSSLSLKQRCKLINKFRKIVVKNGDLIQNTLQKETGKKDFDVFIEYFTFLEHLKQIPKIAKKALKKEKRNSGLMKNKKSYVVYEPLGIVGVISPWNYPLATPMISSIEALVAGNNVILKPSEHTPLTPQIAKRLWDKYIGYEDAFQIINGRGDLGRLMVQSKYIDLIFFTGSTKVGRMIARDCGEQLKPTILELGGKDPMVVLKDADINRAAESAIFGGFSNAGQTCISTEEVFVEGEVYDRFVKVISEKIKNVSSGANENDDLGPMIVSENTNKVKEHIDEVKENCRFVNGERNNGDMFIAPTLILDPPKESRVVNEETFGPVLSVRPFNDDSQLLSMIHKTGYGLSASIFGRNKKRITTITSSIKTGNVSINDVLTHYGIASLPFGGEGFSGVGKSHGPEGLRALSRIKSIVVNRFNFINEPWWFGRSKSIERFLKKAVNFLYR